MLDLLVWLLVLLLVFGLAYGIVQLVAPAPIRNYALGAVLLILLIVLLAAVTGGIASPWHFR
jgi:hypothetical protein